jgi:chromosome segregation ATPase
MTNQMIEGRRADSARRQQRVIKALQDAVQAGGAISVSAIARAAGVDRTFLYRHPELLEQVHTAEATPAHSAADSTVSWVSLQADLANAHGRAARQDARIRQLERKLTELLGEQVWAESGLGAHHDIEQLQRRITTLEQRIVELTAELDERTQDLDAARASNRELMTHLNTGAARG